MDQDLKKRVNDSTEAMVGDLIDEYTARYKHSINAAAKQLAEQLKARFGFQLALDPNSPEMKAPELLEKHITAGLEKELNDKEALIGSAYLNMIIRENYLHAVDRKWLDHLENMEALREAVYLRHYAQKNPLTEYKLEGYRIFEDMIEEIRQEIASRMHLIRIQIAEGGAERRPASRSIGTIQSANHSSMSSFGGASQSAGSSPLARASQPDSATVVRTQPKVGRNDPCPCGSGKKYKFCHGAK
jgi:preprotein translocase subunit SecA